MEPWFLFTLPWLLSLIALRHGLSAMWLGLWMTEFYLQASCAFQPFIPTPLVVTFPPSPNHEILTGEWKRQFTPHSPFGCEDGLLTGQGKVWNRAKATIKALLWKAMYCMLCDHQGACLACSVTSFPHPWLDGPEEAATPFTEWLSQSFPDCEVPVFV